MNLPQHYESDILFYFDGRPTELALYQAFFHQMSRMFPDASVKVQKSQISFYGRHLFAAASWPLRRKKEWPKECIVVTIGLSHRIEAPRIAIAVEPYPNRWTHHVVISAPEQIDQELMEWLNEAYMFAQMKSS